jgi:hypothetical protein
MFRTKHVSFNATITLKPFKIDNVPVNVIVVITICSQQSQQQMFKEGGLIKIKRVDKWQ